MFNVHNDLYGSVSNNPPKEGLITLHASWIHCHKWWNITREGALTVGGLLTPFVI